MRSTRRTGRTPNEIVEIAPVACPNGHAFGPGRAWVSYLPCSCAPGGHRVYECVECGVKIYDPPHAGESFDGAYPGPPSCR